MSELNDPARVFFCGKHGNLDWGAGNMCPRCYEIMEAGLCRDCEKHKGTAKVCDSALDAIHGFSIKICQCCYVKRIQVAYDDIVKNLAEQKAALEAGGCS